MLNTQRFETRLLTLVQVGDCWRYAGPLGRPSWGGTPLPWRASLHLYKEGQGCPSKYTTPLSLNLNPSRRPPPLLLFLLFPKTGSLTENWQFDFFNLGFELTLYFGQREHLVHDAIIPTCNDTFMYPLPPRSAGHSGTF